MKCLVIVDVQKQYSKDYEGNPLFDNDYLNELKSISANYEAVFFLFDCVSGEIDIPYHFIEIEEYKFSKRFYKNYAGLCFDQIEELLEENDENLKIISKGETYSYYGELVLATNNCHETQTVNESLKNLIKEVGMYSEVHLCGGAEGECLEDIEVVFDYFDINYDKLENLVYPKYSAMPFSIEDHEWISINCPL